MHFRVVSKGQGTELGIFFGLVVKFQLFGGGGLDTPDTLYEGKKNTVSPPPLPQRYLDPDNADKQTT